MASPRQEQANLRLVRAIEVAEDFEAYLEAVQLGGDLNAISELYDRPLIFSAVYVQEEKIVEDMIARGVDVNTSTEDGWTPLHEAAQTGNIEIARLLLDAGASLTASSRGGLYRYPIHAASGAAILYLAERGADLNARDEIGRTPLHLWAMGNSVEEVQILLQAGVDPYPLDNEGKSPLDYLNPRFSSYQAMMDAFAPSIAMRDRLALNVSTAQAVKNEWPSGECEKCGRQAHEGRCRL